MAFNKGTNCCSLYWTNNFQEEGNVCFLRFAQLTRQVIFTVEVVLHVLTQIQNIQQDSRGGCDLLGRPSSFSQWGLGLWPRFRLSIPHNPNRGSDP